MNASRPFFPKVASLTRPLALVAVCAVLSACVSTPFREAVIDPKSAVAGDVERLTRGEGTFPTFADIPKTPQDVRPLAQFGVAARSLTAAGDDLLRATAPETWTLQATEAFVEKARRDAGPEIEPPKPGEAEAFARELRERATPPPPR
ncbi:hypothetical protein [Phenylobacterium sp.]|uniref:hypothetical protein n=1 Tax=Phenylobacterium sp. TaxID=1871053 RepID=UPI0037CC1E02